MLLNSFEFIFLFLPFSLAVHYALRPFGTVYQTAAIALLSLVFYWIWAGVHTLWLAISIVANFALAGSIWRAPAGSRKAYRWLCAAVALNIFYLVYFKYSQFFGVQFLRIEPAYLAGALPLGISFFTFTQIMYLIDLYRRHATPQGPVTYAAFVAFYPHLPSGPLYHYSEIMPQFHERKRGTAWEDLSVGWTIFVIGLSKKIIADGFAPIADAAFAAPAAELTAFGAWFGVLAYSLQIYFDFSGYSDMAIGIARMFGIVFPENFRSPYKAVSIIDFWRRWHMTLSRFLRDYLYIPLGGNRRGESRRMANILLTMTIGGLWHGANWTFVAWGALHGLFLVINHGWRRLPVRVEIPLAASIALTFLCVTIAWVFFRAHDLSHATAILQAMAGIGPAPSAGVFVFPRPATLLDPAAFLAAFMDPQLQNFLWMLLGFALVWAAPNTQTIMRRHRPVLGAGYGASPRLTWAPEWSWAFATAVLFGICVTQIPTAKVFLYWSF